MILFFDIKKRLADWLINRFLKRQLPSIIRGLLKMAGGALSGWGLAQESQALEGAADNLTTIVVGLAVMGVGQAMSWLEKNKTDSKDN